MPRLALAVALTSLLAAFAAPARAQISPPASRIEPLAPGEQVAEHRPIAFQVRTTAPDGSVVIRISGSPQLEDSGLLRISGGRGIDLATTTGDDPEVHIARTSTAFLAARRPGPYFWQAYLTGDAATHAEEPIGEVQRVTVTGAHHAHARLYPTFGPRGHASFYLSSHRFPSTVGGPRFAAIARAAARRWHLRARRWTSLRAGRADGFDVAGFTALPKGVLGLQTDFQLRGRTVEQDVQFNAAAPWNDGPGYPDFDQVDLESVVLHELGHMAGVKRHRARCANSPMVAGLGSGEWWRGPNDAWFFGCGASSASVDLRPAAGGWRFAHRVVELG